MSLKRRVAKGKANPATDPVGVPLNDQTTVTRSSGLAGMIAKIGRLKGVLAAVAGVGAVVGGLSGYWNAYQATTGVHSSLLATVGTGSAGPLSIVVLPFANLTGDTQQAYLADGLTAAITADLSRIRDAFVVSGTTAFVYKDKALTVAQIGTELGVRFALQGSVQRDHKTIRIQAQLADAASNAQLWSEAFEGSLESLFAIQELVTSRVGNSIGHHMVVLAARDSEKRKSNATAADLMLRARAIKLLPVSAKHFEEEEALFRQVLKIEPDNVQAISGLSVALASAVDSGFVGDPAVAESQLNQAHQLALKVKNIDPTLADIYFPLSYYALVHGDWDEVRRSEQAALSLEPKNPLRYNAAAAYRFYAGEPDKAIELLTRAIHLDPKHVTEFVLLNMGRSLFMKGEDNAAIEWLLKSIDVNPRWAFSRAYLAVAYASKGDTRRSQESVAATLKIDPTFSLTRTETPPENFPAPYLKYLHDRLLPAIRLARLP